jgi:hypothetical protein
MNTLILVIGQIRSASLTAERWERYLLDVLRRSGRVCVALCHCAGYSEPDPLFRRVADYIWEIPEPENLTDLFTMEAARLGASDPEGWKLLLQISGNWLGEITESGGKRPGSAARVWLLKHHALQMIRTLGLAEQFDCFIATRSDFYYIAAHAAPEALSPGYVWAQRDQSYGGVPDRHTVVAMRDVDLVLDWLSPILLDYDRLHRLMKHGTMSWNAESYMKLLLMCRRRYHRLRRFPNTMFLVRSDQAATTWAEGVYDESLGFRVKYPDEKEAAERNAAALAAVNYDPHFIRRQTWIERLDTMVHALPPWSYAMTRKLDNRINRTNLWLDRVMNRADG